MSDEREAPPTAATATLEQLAYDAWLLCERCRVPVARGDDWCARCSAAVDAEQRAVQPWSSGAARFAPRELDVVELLHDVPYGLALLPRGTPGTVVLATAHGGIMVEVCDAHGGTVALVDLEAGDVDVVERF